MKKKLRKIIVNECSYLWRIDEKFIGVELNPGQYSARVKAVIFKEGLKNTPLTVIFNVMEDAIAGTRITSSGTDINLHKPQNIRMLLEEGLRLGWTPENKELILENGLAIYKKLGYKVEGI